MDATALKALPRAQLQKLAKIHGVRANGKSEIIVAKLLHMHPDGVPRNDLEAENVEPTSASAVVPRRALQKESPALIKSAAPVDAINTITGTAGQLKAGEQSKKAETLNAPGEQTPSKLPRMGLSTSSQGPQLNGGGTGEQQTSSQQEGASSSRAPPTDTHAQEVEEPRTSADQSGDRQSKKKSKPTLNIRRAKSVLHKLLGPINTHSNMLYMETEMNQMQSHIKRTCKAVKVRLEAIQSMRVVLEEEYMMKLKEEPELWGAPKQHNISNAISRPTKRAAAPLPAKAPEQAMASNPLLQTYAGGLPRFGGTARTFNHNDGPRPTPNSGHPLPAPGMAPEQATASNPLLQTYAGGLPRFGGTARTFNHNDGPRTSPNNGHPLPVSGDEDVFARRNQLKRARGADSDDSEDDSNSRFKRPKRLV